MRFNLKTPVPKNRPVLYYKNKPKLIFLAYGIYRTGQIIHVSGVRVKRHYNDDTGRYYVNLNIGRLKEPYVKRMKKFDLINLLYCTYHDMDVNNIPEDSVITSKTGDLVNFVLDDLVLEKRRLYL